MNFVCSQLGGSDLLHLVIVRQLKRTVNKLTVARTQFFLSAIFNTKRRIIVDLIIMLSTLH